MNEQLSHDFYQTVRDYEPLAADAEQLLFQRYQTQLGKFLLQTLNQRTRNLSRYQHLDCAAVTRFLNRSAHAKSCDLPQDDDWLELLSEVKQHCSLTQLQRLLKQASGYISKPQHKAAKQALQQLFSLRAEIALHNLRLVIKVAREYNYLSLPWNDVIQEGNIGLLKAIEKYQLSHGTRFSTYAWWWIRQHISLYLKRNSSVVRRPEQLFDKMLSLIHQLNKKGLSFTQGNIKKIAHQLDCSRSELESLLVMAFPDQSFDHSPRDQESSGYEVFSEMVHDDPADQLAGHSVNKLLESLTPLEQTIVILRFGLNNVDHHSFREIGAVIGKSTERTRQLEAQAIKKLQAVVAHNSQGLGT